MYAFSAFVEMSQGVLQAVGALVGPNLSRAALPAGIVLGVGLLGAGSGILGLILGGTLGAMMGALVVAWQLSRHGMRIRGGSTRLPKAEAQHFLRNFRALAIATSITHLAPLISQWLAGLLGPGSVSALGYASRLTIGAGSLISGAFAPVLLGYFATESGSSDPAPVRRTFIDFATLFAWTGCCMTLGFWTTSEYLIQVIYQRGALTDTNAHHVAVLANYYAPQFPLLLAATAATAMISGRALNRVFVPINAILLVSNLILSIILMTVLSTGGIALASSLTYALSLGLLMATLIRRGVVSADRTSLLRFVTPFALLTCAGAVVFAGDLRVTKNTGLMQYAGATLVVIVFLVVAFASNRAFIVRAFARSRRS